jgi:hypothetical protein
MSSRTGHGSSQVFEMLQAFLCISWACDFRAGDNASIFLVGPSRQTEALLSCLDGLALLVSRRASFYVEEDSALPPRWLLTAARIADHDVGKSPPSTRRSRPSLNDNPSLRATLYAAGGVGEIY